MFVLLGALHFIYAELACFVCDHRRDDDDDVDDVTSDATRDCILFTPSSDVCVFIVLCWPCLLVCICTQANRCEFGRPGWLAGYIALGTLII